MRLLQGRLFLRHILKNAPVIFWCIFKNIEEQADLIRTLVRKNRQERFLTSAHFADGPEGVRAGKPE